MALAGSYLMEMNCVDASVIHQQQTRDHALFKEMQLVDQTAWLGAVAVSSPYFLLILLSGTTKLSEPFFFQISLVILHTLSNSTLLRNVATVE